MGITKQNTVAHFLVLTSVFMIAVFAISVPSFTHAQGIPDVMGQAAALGLDELSAPNVDLIVSSSGIIGSTATIKANTTNITDTVSSFDWYLDDQPMLLASGRARTDFSFTTSKSFHIVRLVISSDGKKVAENAVSINSFTVSLVWNTDTFVPAGYEGKPLPSVGSRITVTAFPDIRGEVPENLLYTWYIDAESQVRNTLAEQEFSFVASKNVAFVSIKVEVSNLSQSIMVSKAIVIPLAKPAVIVTPSDSVFLLAGGKATIIAQPFYFHIATANDLSYEWFFSGKNIIGTPPDPNELILLIPKDSGTGTQYLRVEARNNVVLGEQARTDIPVTVY